MLRINPDGSIPSDNPFLSQTTGINQAIWARGLRNPFTFAIDPTNGRIHINDVGEDTWEEVNHGVAGSNYGWPQTEGNESGRCRGRALSDSHLSITRGGVCAITGGGVLSARHRHVPRRVRGALFLRRFLRRLHPHVEPAELHDADGLRHRHQLAGRSSRCTRTARSTISRAAAAANCSACSSPRTPRRRISAQPANVTVAAGQSATFAVTASGTAPLAYQWQRNGVNIAGATRAHVHVRPRPPRTTARCSACSSAMPAAPRSATRRR